MSYPIVIKKQIFKKDLTFLNNVCRYHLDNDLYEVDDHSFFRKKVYNSELLTSFHKNLTQTVSKIAEIELKPSYNFISLYGKDGFCPAHFDRPQCQYTIDIQVSCDVTWPIFVKNIEYCLSDGDAICYSGSNHFHYRRLPPLDMTHCWMIFLHFVPADFNGETK
jgi:hypothetical protein